MRPTLPKYFLHCLRGNLSVSQFLIFLLNSFDVPRFLELKTTDCLSQCKQCKQCNLFPSVELNYNVGCTGLNKMENIINDLRGKPFFYLNIFTVRFWRVFLWMLTELRFMLNLVLVD